MFAERVRWMPGSFTRAAPEPGFSVAFRERVNHMDPHDLRKPKDPPCDGSCFMTLNDEHQGEGGTLVFVAVYITMTPGIAQGILC